MRLFVLGICLTAVACVASPTSVDVLGPWGGLHITLQVTSAGGRLEYDCADGVIDEPIRPDTEGRFTAVGTHTPGRGGPVRLDEILPALRARYDGHVDGERMTLTVTLIDSREMLGPFQLRRGSSGQLVRCL